MSSFNVDLNVADVQVVFEKPEDEGATIEFAKLIQMVGITIPIGDPRSQMAAVMPLGAVASILGREHLEKIIEGATEALTFFEDKPNMPADFAIAGNMQQAAEFAKQLDDAKQGKRA